MVERDEAGVEKITSARTYRAGSDTLRQVFFGLTDLELHSRFVPGAKQDAFDVELPPDVEKLRG